MFVSPWYATMARIPAVTSRRKNRPRLGKNSSVVRRCFCVMVRDSFSGEVATTPSRSLRAARSASSFCWRRRSSSCSATGMGEAAGVGEAACCTGDDITAVVSDWLAGAALVSAPACSPSAASPRNRPVCTEVCSGSPGDEDEAALRCGTADSNRWVASGSLCCGATCSGRGLGV